MKLYRLGALLALLMAAAAVAVPAGAAPPAPCGGAFSDPSGDGIMVGPTASTPLPNLDVTEVFFRRTAGPNNTKVVTANFRVKELTKAVPQDRVGIFWQLVVDSGGDDYFALYAQVLKNGATSFNYVSYIDEPEPRGSTTGTLHEGPGGVVEIVIPAAHVPASGRLPKPVVTTRTILAGTGDTASLGEAIDRAPDGTATGPDVTLVDCPAEPTGGEPTPTPSATAEPTSTATPEPTPTSSATPEPTQQAQQPQQQQQAAPQQPAPQTTAAPAPKPAKKAKAKSCAAKAKARYKGKKNAKKLKAALKKCKKAKKKSRR